MTITKNDIDDLIKVIMQDCPLPSVADLISVAREEDADVFFDFIQEHYDARQISEGLAEHDRRVKLVQQLYGSSNQGSSDPTSDSDDSE